MFAVGKIKYDTDIICRRSGCAALDMAYVASGRYDGYFQSNLNLWDIAAGIVIIKEAGGYLKDLNGNDIYYNKSSTKINSVLACNSFIINNLINLFSK